MSRAPRLVLAMTILGLAACPSRDQNGDAGSTTADSGSTDAGALSDAGPASRTLNWRLTARATDGGEAQVVVPSQAPAQIDPAISLDLHLDVPLSDFRVRLLDWRDEIPVSDDTSTTTDAGVSYHLGLAAPLKSGRAYTLVIEPAVGPELTDQSGRAWDEIRQPLQVSGEVELPPGKPSKRRRGK